MNPTQKYFLDNMNINEICKLYDPSEVAVQARIRKTPILTEIDLIKENMKSEIDRLNTDLTKPMIQQLANYIWNNYLTSIQRGSFTTLMNNVNNINLNDAKIKNDSIDRMNQINVEQVTSNPFAVSFYGGAEFNDENDIERLIFNNNW